MIFWRNDSKQEMSNTSWPQFYDLCRIEFDGDIQRLIRNEMSYWNEPNKNSLNSFPCDFKWRFCEHSSWTNKLRTWMFVIVVVVLSFVHRCAPSQKKRKKIYFLLPKTMSLYRPYAVHVIYIDRTILKQVLF